MTAEEFDNHHQHDLGDDFWGSHELYPVEDWQYEVSNDETRLGYWDWVLIKIETT
ncbi:hypothetical protein [uncultured Marinobacter sp.]|uniref:hypothetical protein n=1 Tax=uncultured Marinobacter sp. TaxID=187379 RepID=UPI0025972268|nr:hypothetical protein [uncultured Marinobacter sp.]